MTPRELTERTGLTWSSVYRTITALLAAGAPIEVGEAEAAIGRPPATYRLTVDGLRQWIG